MPVFVARTIFGNLCYIGFTFVYKLLPLGIGSTLIASNPFAIAFLAYFFLGENVTFFEIAAIFVMFSGITMMAMSNPNSKQDELDVEGELQKGAHNQYITGIIIGLFTALFLALSTITSRKLKFVDT